MIQPTSSVGYGVARTWRLHVLAGPQRQPLESLLVAGERLDRRLHLAHPPRQPDGALLDDPDAKRRDAAPARRRRSSWPASAWAARGSPCSRPSGSSRRPRGSRGPAGRRSRSTSGRAAGRRRRRGTGRGCRPPRPSPRPGRGRRGWGSAGAGRPTARAARPRPARQRPCRRRPPSRSRPAARRPSAAAGRRPSRTRPWPGCGRGRRRRPGRGRRRARAGSRALLWNVLNTNWLAKPSRSSAAGRSSAMNDPVASQFLRFMISSASSARNCRVGVLAPGPLEQILAVDHADRPDDHRLEPLVARRDRRTRVASRPAPSRGCRHRGPIGPARTAWAQSYDGRASGDLLAMPPVGSSWKSQAPVEGRVAPQTGKIGRNTCATAARCVTFGRRCVRVGRARTGRFLKGGRMASRRAAARRRQRLVLAFLAFLLVVSVVAPAAMSRATPLGFTIHADQRRGRLGHSGPAVRRRR